MKPKPCPICPGTGEYTGKLARRLHYRCRSCGMDFSIKERDVPREKKKLKKGWP